MNLLEDLSGTLPEDNAEMLAVIDRVAPPPGSTAITGRRFLRQRHFRGTPANKVVDGLYGDVFILGALSSLPVPGVGNAVRSRGRVPLVNTEVRALP